MAIVVRREAGIYAYEALAAPRGLRPDRRRRRGRTRRVRRPARRRRSDPAARQVGRDPRPRRLQAAHAAGARAGLRPDPEAGPRLVGGQRRPRRVRPPRHAPGQPRRRCAGRCCGCEPDADVRRSPTASRSTGSACRTWRSGRATGWRPASPRRPSIAKVTRDRIMGGWHERAARLRLRHPQGLLHAAAPGASRGARAQPHPPLVLRERPPDGRPKVGRVEGRSTPRVASSS